MSKERVYLDTTIRHGEIRPLTRFASAEFLSRAGLPTEPSYVYGRSDVNPGSALYLGATKLKPDGLFNGGYPVVICELGDNTWHLVGFDKKPPMNPESQEFHDFCDKALRKVGKETSLTPYILEYFSQVAEKKRNVAVTVYQKIFSTAK